jgi:hypothetical protein
MVRIFKKRNTFAFLIFKLLMILLLLLFYYSYYYHLLPTAVVAVVVMVEVDSYVYLDSYQPLLLLLTSTTSCSSLAEYESTIESMSEDQLTELEADCYWCMTMLLDGIQVRRS